MPFFRNIEEGGTLSHTFSFDDFGFVDDVIFDWDAEVSYGGEALKDSDYTITTNFGKSSVTVTFDAIDDGQIENVEDAILTLTGYIDWIDLDPGGHNVYVNILGEHVQGKLERENVNETLTIDINSLPNPLKQDAHVLVGTNEPIINLLVSNRKLIE